MPVAQSQVELRHQLLDRLAEARANTDQLFSIVKPEALYDRPIPERHRIIFYIGHLEAFDWNLLRERALSLGSFHPDYDRLFAFGIDPVGVACRRTNLRTGRRWRQSKITSARRAKHWTRRWQTGSRMTNPATPI